MHLQKRCYCKFVFNLDVCSLILKEIALYSTCCLLLMNISTLATWSFIYILCARFYWWAIRKLEFWWRILAHNSNFHCIALKMSSGAHCRVGEFIFSFSVHWSEQVAEKCPVYLRWERSLKHRQEGTLKQCIFHLIPCDSRKLGNWKIMCWS